MRSVARLARGSRGASLGAGIVVTFLLVLVFSLAFGWINPVGSVAAVFLAGLAGGYVAGPGARRGASAAVAGAVIGGALAAGGLVAIIASGIYELPFIQKNPTPLELVELIAATLVPAMFFAGLGGLAGGALRARRERVVSLPPFAAAGRCVHCGALLPSQAVYCPQCGVRRV